jgi:hypothetical protein
VHSRKRIDGCCRVPKKNGKSKVKKEEETPKKRSPKSASKKKVVDLSDEEKFKTPVKKTKSTPATQEKKRKPDEDEEAPSTPLSSKKTPKRQKAESPALGLFANLLSEKDLKAVPAFSPTMRRAVPKTEEEDEEMVWNSAKSAEVLELDKKDHSVIRHAGKREQIAVS